MSILVEKFIEFGLTKPEATIISALIEKNIIPKKVLPEITGVKGRELEQAIESLSSKSLLAKVGEYLVPLPPITFFVENIYNFLVDIKKISSSLKKDLLESLRRLSVESEKLSISSNLSEAIKSFDSLENNLTGFKNDITTAVNKIGESLNKLGGLVQEYNVHLRSLETKISGLSNSIEKLKDGELIDEQVSRRIKEGLKKEIEKILSEYYPVLEKIDVLYKEMQETIKVLRGEIVNIFDDTLNRLDLAVKAIEKGVPDVVSSIVSSIQKSIEEFYGRFEDKIIKLSEGLLKNFQLNKEATLGMLKSVKKDIKEGYASIIDAAFRDMEKIITRFNDDLVSTSKEVREGVIAELNRKIDEINRNKGKLENSFNENRIKIETIPQAYEKAIEESTEIITREFYNVFNKRIEKLKELEKETWVWLSQKIIDTADKIIATTDTLRNGYSSLLKEISTNLNILDEYILALPNKIYNTLDREWQNFLTEAMGRFKKFVETVENRIEADKTELIENFYHSLEGFSRALMKTDQNDEVILKETISASYDTLGNVIKKIRDKVESLKGGINKDKEGVDIDEVLTEILNELDKLLSNELNFYKQRLLKFIEERYSRRTEGFSQNLDNLKKIVETNLSKMVSSLVSTFSSIQTGYLEDLSTLIETVKLIYSNQLEAFNTLVSSIITNVNKKANSTFENAMKIVTEHSDNMVAIFRETSTEIKERIDKFLNEFTEELNSLPEDYKGAIKKVSIDAREAISKISINVSKLMDDIKEDILRSTDESQMALKSIVKLIENKLSGVEKRLQSINEEIKQMTKSDIEEGSKLINDYVEKVINDLMVDLEKNINEIETNITDILDLLKGKIGESLRNQSQELSNKLKEELEGAIREALKKIENLKKERDEVKQFIEEISKRSDKAIGLEKIVDITKKLRDEIDSFTNALLNVIIKSINEVYSKNIKGVITETKDIINNLSEKIGNTKTNIEEIDNLVKTFNINDMLTKVSNIEDKIFTLSSLSKESFETYRNAIQNLSSELEKASSSKIDEVMASLDKLFQTINSYYLFLATFGEKYDENIKSLVKYARTIYDLEIMEKTIESILEEVTPSATIYILPKQPFKTNDIQLKKLRNGHNLVSAKNYLKALGNGEITARTLLTLVEKENPLVIMSHSKNKVLTFHKDITGVKLIEIDHDNLAKFFQKLFTK